MTKMALEESWSVPRSLGGLEYLLNFTVYTENISMGAWELLGRYHLLYSYLKFKPFFFFLEEEIRARARFWRDQNLLDRANAMPMKSCDALERIAEAGWYEASEDHKWQYLTYRTAPSARQYWQTIRRQACQHPSCSIKVQSDSEWNFPYFLPLYRLTGKAIYNKKTVFFSVDYTQ